MIDQEKDKMIFLLGDDHNIVRQGVQFIIDDIVDNATIFHASSLKKILEQIKTNTIDIAILDAHFPDGNCLSIIETIKQSQPNIKILIFTAFDEENYSLKFIKAGADGFLNKLSDEADIKQAILNIIESGKHFTPFTQKLIKLSSHNPGIINPLNLLTARELQVAELLMKGLGNLEIANNLNLQQNTISTFKKRIFEKLQIETLVELIDLMKIHHVF